MKKINCPVCKGNIFVEVEQSTNDWNTFLLGKCYCCIECGHVMWFRNDVVDGHKQSLEEIKTIDEQIMSLENEKAKLKGVLYDVSDYEKQKKELQEKLSFYEHEDGDSKKVRVLRECIEEMNRFIKEGVNRSAESSLITIDSKIKMLNEKKDKLRVETVIIE